MAKACFFCKPNNEYVCDGEHCGRCMAGQEPLGEDQKPSERMYDGRPWIPGEVDDERD